MSKITHVEDVTGKNPFQTNNGTKISSIFYPVVEEYYKAVQKSLNDMREYTPSIEVLKQLEQNLQELLQKINGGAPTTDLTKLPASIYNIFKGCEPSFLFAKEEIIPGSVADDLSKKHYTDLGETVLSYLANAYGLKNNHIEQGDKESGKLNNYPMSLRTKIISFVSLGLSSVGGVSTGISVGNLVMMTMTADVTNELFATVTSGILVGFATFATLMAPGVWAILSSDVKDEKTFLKTLSGDQYRLNMKPILGSMETYLLTEKG